MKYLLEMNLRGSTYWLRYFDPGHYQWEGLKDNASEMSYEQVHDMKMKLRDNILLKMKIIQL